MGRKFLLVPAAGSVAVDPQQPGGYPLRPEDAGRIFISASRAGEGLRGGCPVRRFGGCIPSAGTLRMPGETRRWAYPRAFSLADELNDQIPFARTGVEIHIDDLLPLSQNQPPAGEGDGQRRAEQRGAQVRVAVAVVPGGVVGALPPGGQKLLEHPLQIGHATRFIFERGQRAGRGRAEDRRRSRLQVALPDRSLHRIGDIPHVGLPQRG